MDKTTDKTTVTDRMVEYISNKYPDDKFLYSKPYGGGAGVEGKEIIVSSINYPDADIWVSFHTDSEGAEQFRDNYLYFKYQNEVTKLIDSALTNVFGKDFYFQNDTSIQTGAANLTKASSLENYLSDNLSGIGFVAVVSPDYFYDKKSIENELSNIFNDKKICIALATILFSDNDDAYQKLSNGEISYYEYTGFSQNDKMFTVSKNENGADYSFEWR